MLLEPSVLGTEEGAGITVLAKNSARWRTPVTAARCCTPYSAYGQWRHRPITDSNFLCAPSRIDGVSVTGGDAGGGIYVNGWAHNLEISNNRVYGNAGALQRRRPHRRALPGAGDFPLNAAGTARNLVGPASDGSSPASATTRTSRSTTTPSPRTARSKARPPAAAPAAACRSAPGTDGYSVDHNWICGNFSSSDGGGIGHIGFSQNGGNQSNTSRTQILFNQSFQQTGSTHGGGIVVIGEPALPVRSRWAPAT